METPAIPRGLNAPPSTKAFAEGVALLRQRYATAVLLDGETGEAYRRYLLDWLASRAAPEIPGLGLVQSCPELLGVDGLVFLFAHARDYRDVALLDALRNCEAFRHLDFDDVEERFLLQALAKRMPWAVPTIQARMELPRRRTLLTVSCGERGFTLSSWWLMDMGRYPLSDTSIDVEGLQFLIEQRMAFSFDGGAGSLPPMPRELQAHLIRSQNWRQTA